MKAKKIALSTKGKFVRTYQKAVVLAAPAIMAAPAFAAETSIDLTTGLAGVAIVGGLMAAGSLKAVPTYVGWGIKKALSMLR